MISIWDELRTALAFLIAPLPVPWIVYFASGGTEERIVLGVSVLVAYAGTFVFGVPTYLISRAWRLTAFWLAPIVGFAWGWLAWHLAFALFAFALGNSPSEIVAPNGAPFASDAIRIGGLSGAIVGSVIWLIARPDRQRASSDSASTRFRAVD
jgi:hypothetical protein